MTEKCELERKALRAVETNITETVDKLDETRNEINQTEVLIELEKLKQRKCSDETQTFKEVLLRGKILSDYIHRNDFKMQQKKLTCSVF